MRAAALKFMKTASDAFWLIPGAMVVAGGLGAELLVQVERRGFVSQWVDAGWLYSGGESGARTLLGAVASSTIGVAGTVFSITIAALAFAASQMGPRLLNNFTRDRGNQATLGLFLGTFAFSLMALRSVRGVEELTFVPHLAVTAAIVLALACVAMLVYFVHHMAGRINVDTVIDLVHEDFRSAIRRLTLTKAAPAAPEAHWTTADVAFATRHGYLQQLDEQSLAEWAASKGAKVRLRVRPGDFIFPGSPVAEASAPAPGLDKAIEAAFAIGSQAVDSADLEYSVRQLVDVAVRALSPGINDPQTALSVIDRLGASLCELAPRHLPTGVTQIDGSAWLTRPVVSYAGLCAAMFHGIRQSAGGSATVLIRMLDMLAKVVEVETDRDRRRILDRHARLIASQAARTLNEPESLVEIRKRQDIFHSRHRG